MIVRGRENTYFFLEKAALSFVLGLGAVTFSFLVLALAGMSFDLARVLMPWGVVLFFAVFTVRSHGDPSDRALSPDPEDGHVGRAVFAALGAILALQVSSVFLRALSKPLESYDAILNFGIKSKMFFMYNGFPLKLSALEGAGQGHLDYPLLIPLCQTWIYKFLGQPNDNLVMILFPLIYVSFGIYFYYSFRRMFGRKQAFLFTFFLCTVPQIANFSANGYGDVALTFMVTAAFIFLVRYFMEKRRDLLALSAVFSGMGFLVKNEGISFILAGFFVITLLVLREKDKKRSLMDIAVFYLIPLAVTVAPWMLVKHVLGVSNSDIELSKLTAAQFQENVRHIPFISNKFQQEIFGPKKWNILWIAVLGFTVLRFRKTKEPYVGIIGVFILLNLFIYFSSFMVLTGKNIYFHVNTTMSRLMMHFSGLSLFFLAFLVKDDIENAFGPERKDVVGERFVFLDRDGVINKDPAGWTPHSYVTTPQDFIILPGVLDGMKIFAKAGYRTVI
ncbi:MAG: glycosyltransferase family 39 protein, partial [Candidatus Omnitrophica bacterium]|nr:glycosyltransferase family 39 protein [Candidatus Omnitrophota bacterium]